MEDDKEKEAFLPLSLPRERFPPTSVFSHRFRFYLNSRFTQELIRAISSNATQFFVNVNNGAHACYIFIIDAPTVIGRSLNNVKKRRVERSCHQICGERNGMGREIAGKRIIL